MSENVFQHPITNPYLIRLLEKYLVVLAQSHAENNRRDIFETMNPLLPFTPLSAHIEHANQCQKSFREYCRIIIIINLLHAQLAHCKPRFVNTRRLRPRTQDIGLVGDIVGGS